MTGHLEDDDAWAEIGEWLAAVRVVKGMQDNRMGILGHYYNGMLDIYTDLTRQSAVFGTHVEQLEMSELKSLRDRVSPADVEANSSSFAIGSTLRLPANRRVGTGCPNLRGARPVGRSHNLGSLAYYYEGSSGDELENIVTSVIAGNTLLTGRGIPVAGECDVKNVQAMKILSLLDAGGSFSEFYALDLKDDVVLLGHDGRLISAIAEGASNSFRCRCIMVNRGAGCRSRCRSGMATLRCCRSARERMVSDCLPPRAFPFLGRCCISGIRTAATVLHAEPNALSTSGPASGLPTTVPSAWDTWRGKSGKPRHCLAYRFTK